MQLLDEQLILRRATLNSLLSYPRDLLIQFRLVGLIGFSFAPRRECSLLGGEGDWPGWPRLETVDQRLS
jgi:hypothetical protein